MGRDPGPGADAASFLHNQLTSGLPAAGQTRRVFARLQTAQGRVKPLAASSAGAGDDEILLACGRPAGSHVKRLSMFVLRAKVKLSAISSSECAAWCSRRRCSSRA